MIFYDFGPFLDFFVRFLIFWCENWHFNIPIDPTRSKSVKRSYPRYPEGSEMPRMRNQHLFFSEIWDLDGLLFSWNIENRAFARILKFDSGNNSILAIFWTSTARSASKFDYWNCEFRRKPSYGVRVMSKTVFKPKSWAIFRVAAFSEIRNLDGLLFFWNIDIYFWTHRNHPKVLYRQPYARRGLFGH